MFPVWTRLPRDRRPPNWDNINDPEVPSESNLQAILGSLRERQMEDPSL